MIQKQEFKSNDKNDTINGKNEKNNTKLNNYFSNEVKKVEV